MIMNLKIRPFLDNLCKKALETLDELTTKVFDFIHIDEMTAFKA